MKRFSTLSLLLVACLLLGLMVGLASCKAKEEPVADNTSVMPPQMPPAAPDANAPKPEAKDTEPAAKPEEKPAADKPAKGEKTIVKIVTAKGTITCELFDKLAPITAGNFLLLAEDGFYDGLTFHRIVPGFCAQGGDPTGTGGGGPGFTIPDEVRPELKHDKGILSMAKTAMPDTGGSQFFICLGGPEVVGHLNMKHAVFGKVTSGMDVVEKLEVGDKMERVEVVSESPNADAAKAKAKAARKPE